MMQRKQFVGLIILLFCSLGPIAHAQQPSRVHRVGHLSAGSGLGIADEAFRKGLRELGYIEGQNLAIEWRFAEGKLDRLPGLAADLVRSKVDVIIVSSTQGALVAKKTTQTVPVVFAIADDPVESGLVASLARPGGNATGVTDLAGDLAGKRLELLKETLPKVSRLGVLVWRPDGPGNAAEKNEIELAARALAIKLQPVEIRAPNDLQAGFSAIIKASANAFMGLTDTRFAGYRQQVVDLSLKRRLPAVYQDRLFVDAGGLMSYGTNRIEWRGRVAYYVDRILKGAKPADLPVERPSKFELVINLKTAKQIGVTIPPNVLARADRIIK
ncbi:MAG TPA: ABC transporter substrate-binding protein [Acidobacteriota bacterium]|nr:ABC transporter substrate-binding protein [Acidobacteriota bacterium]